MTGRSISLILVTVVSLMMVSACSRDKGNAKGIDAYLSSAKRYEASGQYRAAVIQIKNAIQKDPKDPRGHVALANVYIELGQPRQAITELEAFKASSPESVVAMTKSYIDAGKLISADTFLSAHKAELQGRQSDLNRLRGEIALGNGQFKVALRDFRAAASQNPSDVAARLGIARAQAAEGQLGKALATLDDLIKAHPDDAKALLYASVIKTKQGDLPAAENLLTKAASATPSGDALTPLRYAILVNLRENLTKQGKSSEALFYSHLLADATKDAQPLEEKLHKAVDAVAKSDFSKARKLLTEVQDQVPNSQQAGTLLGVVDYLQGNNQAAVKQFERFVDPEVASPRALQMFAMAELKLNHPQAIIDRLKKDIDSKKDGRIVALYGIALISAGNLQQGEKYLRKAVHLDPSNPQLRLPLVRLLNNGGNREAALEQLQAGFKARPKDPLVDAALLQQLVAMNKVEDAQAVVTDLHKSLPDDTAVQVVVANYYAVTGQTRTAAEVLKGLKDLEKSPQALTLLAKLELRTAQYHQAVQRFQDVVRLSPNDPMGYMGIITAYELLKEPKKGVSAVEGFAATGASDTPTLVLAEYYGRHGEFDKAFSALSGAKHTDSKAVRRLKRELNLAKAETLLKQRKYSASRQTLMTALDKSPDDPQLLTVLVNVELQAGNLDEADKVLARLKKAAPDATIATELAGDIAMKRNKPGTARRDYEAVWSKAPSNRLGLKILSTLQQLPGNNGKDINAFLDEWGKRLPGSVTRQIAVAGYAMSTGDNNKARHEYESVLKQHPNAVIALNNLAWIYGAKDLHKALEVSKRAYDLSPGSGAVADTYGWFLYKSGDAKQAKEILAKATRLAPDNKEIRQHFDQVSAAAKGAPQAKGM